MEQSLLQEGDAGSRTDELRQNIPGPQSAHAMLFEVNVLFH